MQLGLSSPDRAVHSPVTVVPARAEPMNLVEDSIVAGRLAGGKVDDRAHSSTIRKRSTSEGIATNEGVATNEGIANPVINSRFHESARGELDCL